jgi:hypothetical protein
MEKLLGFVFVAIAILLVTLAFVPYKECFTTTSRDDFPAMLESCLENIQDHDKYAQIIGNEKHWKVAAALDKALTRDTSNSIVDYRDDSGSMMCVINPRKFQVSNSCTIQGKHRVHSLRPTRGSVDPSGCLVNPNDPNFTEFLEDIDHIMNKQEYDYIAKVKAQANRARANIKAREAQAAADRLKAQEARQQNMQIENENRSTQERVNTVSERARSLAQIKDGSTSEKAVSNARELRMSNVTTNGVRWVMCDGRPRQTWCLMDPNYDGGGWMLLAKMDEGTTFHFDSVHWEQSTELNPTDLTIEAKKGGGIGDAKYPAFNSVPVKDIMVIFLIDIIGGHVTNQTTRGAQGWAWIIKDWWSRDRTNGTTALTGFSTSHARDAPESNPLKFDKEGLDRNIWSHQYNEMKVVIGGHKHLQPSDPPHGFNAWGSVRLGIACNENGPGNYLTNDTWCGIGGGNGSGGCVRTDNESMPSCFSAGDYFGCCGVPGQRRRFKALLFGR